MAFLKVAKDKKGNLLWPTFKKGWTARVSDVRAEALRMATLPDTPPPVKIEIPVEVEVEKPVVPQTVEEKVKEKTNLWGWLVAIFGGSGAGLSALSGAEWPTILAIGGVGLGGLIVVVLLRSQIIAAVKGIREAVEAS